jgi:hypothetical protein
MFHLLAGRFSYDILFSYSFHFFDINDSSRNAAHVFSKTEIPSASTLIVSALEECSKQW